MNKSAYRQVLGEHIRFFDGCGKGAMCPIGTGCLDYPGIKAALEAGLHVVREKPLCFTSVEAEELAALAREKTLW